MKQDKKPQYSDQVYLLHAFMAGFTNAKVHQSSSISFTKNGQGCIYPLKHYEEIFMDNNKVQIP